MDSVKSALDSIGRMWAALKPTQKVVLSASAALMVVLLLWGSAGSVPSMVRVAGPELDASKRQAILAKFQERNQKHEVRGAEIFVPKEDADRVMLELAGEGAVDDDAIWKLVDQTDPFASSADKERRYKRALEQKLGLMIRRVEFVKNASVLITPGSKADRLGFEGDRASASVQVELQDSKKLSQKNAVAIASLVASSVPGLEANRVVISDTKGVSYMLPKEESGAAAAAYFREYERQIEEDIQSRIKLAFRTASVVVRVDVRKTSSEKDTEKYSNPKLDFEKERKRTEKGVGSAPPTVQKGNGGAEAVPEPAARETVDQESEVTKKFDRERIKTIDPAGQIERTNVGVLIPIEVGPDNKELVEAEKELAKIKQWVMQAAGDKATPETVSVQFIASRRPEPIAAIVPPENPASWLTTNATKIGLFGLALAALFVMLRVAQTAMARDTVEELQSLTTALTETGEAAAQAGLPAENELGRLKQNMQDMVGRNPESVAASLKSFMSGR